VERMPTQHRLRLVETVVLFELDRPEVRQKLPALSIESCLTFMRVANAASKTPESAKKRTLELNALLAVMMAGAVQRGELNTRVH